MSIPSNHLESRSEIYLDNAATTRVCEAAQTAALHAMSDAYGNPSSLHRKGLEAERLVIETRKAIATLLRCTPEELYFTSGATIANNLAILGAAFATHKSKGNKIITTTIEHPSVYMPLAMLAEQGYEVVKIPPNPQGFFDPADVAAAVDDQTILVSTMAVNNEIGLMLPVEAIGRAIKAKHPSVLFHVDAVQAFLKQPLSLRESPIDLMSISGHKVYAPKGIGALYCKTGVRLCPLFYGGNQNKLFPGTESVPLIAALGASVATHAPLQEQTAEHCRKLHDYLLESLLQLPDVTLNSSEHCVPHIVNISIAGVKSEVMLHFLEERGIYVSSGSACSKGAKSTVLAGMGFSPSRQDTALRVSFSRETTLEHLDALVAGIREGIAVLHKTSPIEAR